MQHCFIQGYCKFTRNSATDEITGHLQPYGNSSPVKPVRQVELICERGTRFHTLLFQVFPGDVMKVKPALLSGSDSVCLRLVNVHADEVFQLSTTWIKSPILHLIGVHQICNLPNQCRYQITEIFQPEES